MANKVDLPDFDSIAEIAEKIYNLTKQKGLLELTIKIQEKEAIEKSIDGIKIQGKTPSMSYLESTIKITGLENEIIENRKKLYEISAELDYYKNLMDIAKLKIDIWRTLRADERAGLL